MLKYYLLAAALLALPARAATDSELAQIREDIKRVKGAYEARIQALEQRLTEAEAKTQAAASAARAEEGAAQAAPTQQASENAFNPAISLILQGTYNNLSENPGAFRIGGFVPGGGETLGKRGFSLGESELVATANIDPYFRGALTAALAPDDEIEIEEAFFQTLGLSNGFTLKGGRFFSGIGYLNEIHQHAWDFVDAPLAYQAFLGTGARGNYGDDGAQLKWIAPTDLFIELGAEAGRGRNFPGSDRDKNGIGSAALLAHAGGDFGTDFAYRAGVSYLHTAPRDRQFDDFDAASNAVSNRFSGSSRLWIADFVLKYAPNGNATATNFKLQGEYLRRRESGELVFDANGAGSGPLVADFASRQSGWYLQGVYQFIPRWRAGLRYDRLDSGNQALNAADLPAPADANPRRYTAMLDFSPGEFSRFRLQYARDESRPDGVVDDQIILQYIYSLGAHGAHRF